MAGLQNKIYCRTVLMSGCHASTVLTVSVLHDTIINTSATAYKKSSVDIVMELATSANLVLGGHGRASCQKLMQVVRKSKPIQTNGDKE
jgi:hypothetical protein